MDTTTESHEEPLMFEACRYERSLTMYWDKPPGAVPTDRYTVVVDDADRFETESTFTTVEGLEPDREYDVTLLMRHGDSDNGGEEQVLAQKTFRTLQVKRTIDVTQAPYHAVGDGTTMNTRAIQRALNDCGADERVVIPAGIFLTGALFMHSDSELYVARDGVLQGSDNPADYEPWIASRFEGIERRCYASLINIGSLDHTAGYTTEHIRICGEGAIHGGGRTLMRAIIETERVLLSGQLEAMADYVATCESEDTIPGRARGRLIGIANTRDVLISGLSLGYSASWNVHFVYSDHVVTHGCSIASRDVWNGDGWNPDSSTNCVLFDTVFDTGDDMVAIKSGKNPEGNIIARPTEHVRIFGCRAEQGHGIAIGSEMSGGVEDIRIWDCDVARSRNGINIKGTSKRGGYVQDVSVRDCDVAAVLVHSVTYNDDGEAYPGAPVFEKFLFERLHILGRYWNQNDDDVHPTVAMRIEGFNTPYSPVRDVVFRDCTLGGITNGSGLMLMANVSGLSMENISASTNSFEIQEE